MRSRGIASTACFAAVCAGAMLLCPSAALSPAAADTPAAYFSRRLGGPEVTPTRVAIGPDGSVYVAGETTVFDLPGTTAPPTPIDGHPWIFVTAFSRNGDARWTTYQRFNLTGYPSVRGLTVGADGCVWLVARESAGLYPPQYDTDPGRFFPVAKFAPDGTVAFSTAIGGIEMESPHDIATTAEGDAVVVGATRSADFPVVDAFQPQYGGGGLDGFVVRVRGDGSGLAWSTFLGGADFEDATAVAIDEQGDVLVVRHTRGPHGEGYYEVVSWDPVVALDLVRFHADGTFVSETPLPHGDRGGVSSLAPAAGGKLLAGGTAIFGDAGRDYGARRGFAASVGPGAATTDPIWRSDGVDVRRIGVASSGDVAIEADRARYPVNVQSVVVLDPQLEPKATLLAEDDRRTIRCTALAADGTLAVAGRGLIPVDSGSGPALTKRDAFVSTMPLSGAAPVSAVAVRRPRERCFDLTWQAGADPVVRYDVERLEGEGDDAHFELLREVSAETRTVRFDGLLPGRTYTMRLVSVFASGARSSVPVAEASTRPRPITNVRAAAYDGQRIRVTWNRGPTWPWSDVQIERQLGDGEFRRIPSTAYESWPFGSDSPHGFFDALPPMEDVQIRYRVRAVTTEGRLRTAWSYSNAVTTSPSTLVVRQTSGSVSRSDDGSRELILVEGTYGRPNRADDSASFDPRRDELFITAGDLDRPLAVHVSPSSYLGHFHRRPGGWFRAVVERYSVDCQDEQSDIPYWDIEINPRQGRFRIATSTCPRLGVRPDADRIVVGLAYRNLSGGDVRTWTKVPGAAPNLVLR
jgi:hypothetical protein